jgi:serine/threonine protein kinase
LIGQKLAHFEIIGALGEGGMGAVYRARDSRLGREVAIKVLPEEVTGDAERLARFEREAQVIASLNHSGICALYDVGQESDVHYLVMELVEGETLADRIARGMPVEVAIDMATQIAEALEVAHGRGIVHRDLKPANVMVTPEGQVKVLDFGLAKAGTGPTESSPGLAQSPTLTANMTRAGMILGTAAYMSPEQARGEETDQRADVWSWGVILYEMLTGRQLFEEPTVSDTLAAVLRADFDWDALPTKTPAGTSLVLRRTLERDPRNRLHAIADARIELNSIDRVGADENESPKTAPGGLLRWVPLAVAVLATLAAVVSWTRSSSGPDPAVRISSAETGAFRSAALSPDGSRLLIERDGRFYARELDSLVTSEIPGVQDALTSHALFLSPDGERIGYTSASALYTIPVAGGSPSRVCKIPGAYQGPGNIVGATFRGDSIVFALDARGLWEVPASGGQPEQILAPNREEDEAGFHYPTTLPDGETIVTRIRYFGKRADRFVFLRDGQRTDLILPDWNVREVAASTSGHLVVIRGGEEAGIWVVPFSHENLRLSGDPVRILAGNFTRVSLARDNSLLTSTIGTSRAETVRVDRSGKLLGVYEGIGYSRSPAVSPDGRKLLVAGIKVHDGERVVTVTPTRDYRATWSPDGRELIYESGSPERLLRIPSDGSREPTLLTQEDSEDPHWSPDGRWVAYTAERERSSEPTEREIALGLIVQADIIVLPLDGGDPWAFRDSEALEQHPRFSPDGKFLAYSSFESGRSEVYVATFPEGDRRWRVSVEGGRFPRWGADGREIFFVGDRSLMVASFVSEADATGEVAIGAPELLVAAHESPLSFEEFGAAAYDVAPNGEIVALQRNVDGRSALLIQNWPRLLKEK